MNQQPETPGERTGPLVGIFADDLTGALDAAAPFAARGFRTLVSPSHALPGDAGSADVVSVNLDTRRMDPITIAGRTAKAVAAMAALNVHIFVNKVDSTLRGNPGVELLAAMRVLAVDSAVLCPAYPQHGRTVKGGVLLVNGVPVIDTDVGRDRLSPLPSSEIVQIVTDSLRNAGVERRAVVVGDQPGGQQSIGRLSILVPDAESEDDLRVLASRLVSASSTTLVAGSAGLSVALAEAHAKATKGGGRGPLPERRPAARSILIVTASQRAVVEDQLITLGGRIGLAVSEISAGDALNGIGADPVGKLAAAISAGEVAVLKLGKPGPDGGSGPTELRERAGTIVANLGRAAREIIDTACPDALIVIGGDTTGGVLAACGVHSICLQGELQPGTVSGRPVDGSIAGVLLVTRAGGFGDENSLSELVSLLISGLGV